MEREDDVQLIHSILSGDNVAFDVLVEKYQKGVHALVWRKIGDFHYAEEITQDTFIQVYKKLSTLRNPDQFAGWLYVIANRLCIDWMRKRKLTMQSLEDTSMEEVEKVSYTHYLLDRHETESAERRHEIVKKLLAKLPESERTVMTLYYLGEMTTKEIGKFLGVSVKTISSRLSRARKRLQQEEDLLVQEFFGGVQLSANIKQNIMREIPRIKPLSPTVGKPPIVPWAIATSTAILVVIMLGVSSQYLTRFQQPYSFDTTSEMTVDIIDAPIVLDLRSEQDVLNQSGRAFTPSENNGSGQQPHAAVPLLISTQLNQTQETTQQWIESPQPGGTPVMTLLPTPEGELYSVDGKGNIYTLSTHKQSWQHLNNVTSLIDSWQGKAPMVKWNNTLYIVPSNEFFASYEQKVGDQKQLFAIDLVSRVTRQLTQGSHNFDADWFDPAALPVSPQPHLLTTQWAEVKITIE